MADDDVKKKKQDLEESDELTDEVDNGAEESTDESTEEVVENNLEDIDENEEITLESTNESFSDEAYIRALEEMSNDEEGDFDFLSEYKEEDLKSKQKKFEKENGLNESDLDSVKEEDDNIDD
jgi:hypothetical protein